jgi:hypothetical protein
MRLGIPSSAVPPGCAGDAEMVPLPEIVPEHGIVPEPGIVP